MRFASWMSSIGLVALAWGAGCGVEGGEGSERGGEERVALTAPVDGQRFSYSPIRVEGVSTGADWVEVQGERVPVVGGRFETLVDLVPGEQEVRVEGPRGGWDSVTVVLDLEPPLITISRPGPFVDLEPVPIEVSVEGDLVSLTMNQEPVTPGRVVYRPSPGVNLLVFEARDQAGNESVEHGVFVAGQFTEPGPDLAPPSVLHVGPGAWGSVAAAAASLLKTTATAMTPTILYENDYLRLYLDSVDLGGSPALSLTPAVEALDLALDLSDLTVACRLVLHPSNPSPGDVYDVIVHMDLFELDASLSMDVVDGRVHTTIQASEPVVEGLSLKGTFQEVAEPGGELHRLLTSIIPPAIQMVLTDFLPKYLDRLLSMGLSPRTLSLDGEEVVVRPDIMEVTSSRDGVDVVFGLGLEVPEPLPGREGKALLSGDPLPVLDGQGVTIAIGRDALNLVLYRAWQAGLFDLVLDQEDLDAAKTELYLVAGLLGTVARERQVDPETPIRVVVTPTLWPQVSLTDGRLGLVMGGLDLAVQCAGGTGCSLLHCLGSVVLDVGVSIAGDHALQLDVARLDMLLDVLDPDLELQGEREYEPLVRSIVGGLGPMLAAVLRDIPMGGLEALQVDELRLHSRGGYLLLEGMPSWKGGAP